MTGTDDLVAILKKLRLSGILQSLTLRRQEAIDGALSFEEFLERLLRDEVDRRDGKQLDLRIRRANFEHERTLEAFDFAFNADIPRSRIVDLGTCAFVERREDVLFLGPTGTGKSHLAQALGHRACRRGMSVLFTSAADLFGALRSGRGAGSLERRMARYLDVDLLIVDDIGLRPLRQDEPYDLHEIVRQRHERRSTILTSNRAIPEWGAMFPDALLAAATMDRLLQHAHVIELVGASYRNPPPGKKKRAGAA